MKKHINPGGKNSSFTIVNVSDIPDFFEVDEPEADLLTANEAAKQDEEIWLKKLINRVIDMKDVSPYENLMDCETLPIRHAMQNAELGRLGAYSVIITVLKRELLNDVTLSDERYEI